MYYRQGRYPDQAHVKIPEGTVEEEFGREGFSGPVSHLYRSAPPTNWLYIEGDCKPQAWQTEAITTTEERGWWAARAPMLTNAQTTISICRLSRPMQEYARDADGDEVFFIHHGTGSLETDFGVLDYERGDYLVIPRGTVYRFSPQTPTTMLIIESAQAVTLPERGLIGKHALFDPEVIRSPALQPERPRPELERWQLVIKRAGKLTRVTYPSCPITTVGWRGDLSVWQLNVRDIRPILSDRYHLPPSAHATFVTPELVIATFLPRPLETGDPDALRVPFYHSNIDYDEVLFYHDGDFFSRQNIDAGMITFHPQGIHHGPHPKAVEASATKSRTDEIAVMIDARSPLEPTPQALAIARQDYWASWSGAPHKKEDHEHV